MTVDSLPYIFFKDHLILTITTHEFYGQFQEVRTVTEVVAFCDEGFFDYFLSTQNYNRMRSHVQCEDVPVYLPVVMNSLQYKYSGTSLKDHLNIIVQEPRPQKLGLDGPKRLMANFGTVW